MTADRWSLIMTTGRCEQQTLDVQKEPFKDHATPRWIPGSNSNSGDSPNSNPITWLSRNQIKACMGDGPEVFSQDANEAGLKLEEEGSPQQQLIRCKEGTV
jgi:hypothetical protein